MVMEAPNYAVDPPIIAIDPGNEESAYVVYQGGRVISKGKHKNEDVLLLLCASNRPKHLAIEMIASYGMAVGRTVFETCVWIGRFIEAWNGDYTFVYRKDVKMHLCNSVKAKDGNVRQAIIDRYPATGATTKTKPGQIGLKKNPGPLYGISGDVWAALGVAITFCEYEEFQEKRQFLAQENKED